MKTNTQLLRRLLLLLIGFALLIIVKPGWALNWQIEIVDDHEPGDVGGHTSLALDGDGRPHISYYDGSNNSLKYARWDGAAWQIETVDDTRAVGEFTSLALDGDDWAHISFYDITNSSLKYARWDGADWQIETVDNDDGDVGLYTSLALDSDGRPHISYRDFTNRNLKYARWDGAVWQIETVDNDGQVGEYTSLALDEDDQPHISYWDATNSNLKYARWDGADWQIETVDGADGQVGEYTSLVLDVNDWPHISYYDDGNGSLKYARWDGTDWQIETVDNAGNVGLFTSLALDGAGRPHISYYDRANRSLKYARWDGADWQSETVDDDDEFVGWFTSLALGRDGWTHISYYDGDNYNLKYATAKQPTTVAVTAAGPGITANGVAFGKEDILAISELGSGEWEIFFDGSAAGLTNKHDLNAVHVNAADDLYLSFFQNKIKTADLGPVHGQDILHYDGSDFTLFFDGSDVGLTTTAEKIDALHVLDGSSTPVGGCDYYLLISTLGTGKVPAAGGGQLKFQGEDILGFCMTNTGDDTAGFWYLLLDGSAEGMPKNSTDSLSASEDGSVIYLTTQGVFNVDSASGGHSMVYEYDTSTNEFSGPHFSAPANGLNQKVDGLHVAGDLP